MTRLIKLNVGHVGNPFSSPALVDPAEVIYVQRYSFGDESPWYLFRLRGIDQHYLLDLADTRRLLQAMGGDYGDPADWDAEMIVDL